MSTMLTLLLLLPNLVQPLPPPPPVPQAKEDEVHYDPKLGRTFHIPFALRDDVTGKALKLDLFVSRDGGRTWTAAATADPQEQRFRFTAANDGMYWFAVRLTRADGEQEPGRLDQLLSNLKVRVEPSAGGNSER